MDIGRPPGDPGYPPYRRCAEPLAGAGDVLLHIAGDLALEGVDLRDGLSLVIRRDLDAVVAVLDEDVTLAAFSGV